MIDKVQETFALDNRDSYCIKNIFKKDERNDRPDETSRQRAKRLKNEEEAKKNRKREFVYNNSEEITNIIKKSLLKKVEERYKRNMAANKTFNQ